MAKAPELVGARASLGHGVTENLDGHAVAVARAHVRARPQSHEPATPPPKLTDLYQDTNVST